MTLLSTLLAAVFLGTGNCSFKIVHRSVHKYLSLSQKTCEIFTLVVQNVNSENLMQGARLIKGGKLAKKETIRPRVRKNCIVSERKGIRAVCVLTTPLFSQVRSQKNGHIFFVLLLTINF